MAGKKPTGKQMGAIREADKARGATRTSGPPAGTNGSFYNTPKDSSGGRMPVFGVGGHDMDVPGSGVPAARMSEGKGGAQED